MNTEPKIENARIISTMLGAEDHGIFTASLILEGDGWQCAFGGAALDKPSKDRTREPFRVGCAYGCEYIRRLLEVLEVPSWEKLAGALVRVRSGGIGGRIHAVGHIIKDRWFNPETDPTLNNLLKAEREH